MSWGFSAGMTASRLIASIAPSWPRAKETSTRSLTAAAVNDSRGVLLRASEPEPTPEERTTAQGRVRSLVRKPSQRRGRYLEDRFGPEGAGQIERRNGTLLGKGRDASAGTD
jgi:hypothetical protein